MAMAGEAGARLGAVVGRAEQEGEPLQEGPQLLGIAAVEDHRLRPALGFELLQVLGDGVEGLRPGDGDHLRPTRGGPTRLSGRAQPVLVVDPLPLGGALGAEGAPLLRVLERALDLDDAAVLDVAVETALGRGVADGTDRFAHLDPGGFARDLALDHPLKLVHVASISIDAPVAALSRPCLRTPADRQQSTRLTPARRPSCQTRSW